MSYPLVSVIIPVYQAENFVTECIRSVQAQNYPELEIILVDDGSTDCSGQMCEESAAADPRIRVLHQNNKGSGAARNAGIKEATGKYLLFLDADDKLQQSGKRKPGQYRVSVSGIFPKRSTFLRLGQALPQILSGGSRFVDSPLQLRRR